MPDGTYHAICKVLETEYGLDLVNEIVPMLAELNDEFAEENKMFLLLPSRKGSRIVVMRFQDKKGGLV